MDSADFLDLLQIKLGVASDNKLAQAIEMERTRVSMYRTHKREFDALTCVAVATLLELPAQYVMAEIEAARSKNPRVKALWHTMAHLAKKGVAAVTIILSVGLLLSPVSVDAAAGAQNSLNSLYIMRIRRCGRWLVKVLVRAYRAGCLRYVTSPT